MLIFTAKKETSMKIVRKIQSQIDGSIKYSLRNETNSVFEAVYMHSLSKQSASLCISTQYGCKMGCVFCASSPSTYEGNIKSDEMMEAVLLIEEDVTANGFTIPSCYDLKGVGEPMLNYDNVVDFYKNAIQRTHISSITLSSCGIAPEIRCLAMEEDVDFDIYLSLHNPFQDEREMMMPISRKYGVYDAIDSFDFYAKQKNKMVVASYLLIEGINNTQRHFEKLISVLNSANFVIEILLYNDINKGDFKRPKEEEAYELKDYFESRGFQSKVVVSKGRDIQSACGQLRNQVICDMQ